MANRTKSRFVALCRAEVGYHEKETNSNLYDKTANAGDGNYTKYAVENAKAGMYNGNKNGFPYCDVFVDNMMLHLCDMDPVEAEKRLHQTGDLGAGVGYSARYYKNAGKFFTKNPEVGDQIFLYGFGHTGVVVEVHDTTIQVVEGNSNNRVEENKYWLSDTSIDGYGRPEFDPEPEIVPEPKPVNPDKTVEQLAHEVLDGKWGNGAERKRRLEEAGYVYATVQDRVNFLIRHPDPPKKSIDEVAREVIRGKWGNGGDRKKNLTDAGYDYNAVQARVNELLR